MKSKYEISIWTDEFNEELNRFVEKKLMVIGSNTMTSENRARDPKMINNINGTNKFSFTIYDNYIDTRTGELIKNPYVPYLVNERKIKVFWKDEWYDLLIKQIKEDQVNHSFTYNCEDAYVTELSRTGFELVFDTELQNNIGTAGELVAATLENTDWRFDENSDAIYQQLEEPVYEVVTLNNFDATKDIGATESTLIPIDSSLLIYYSFAQDINNLKDEIQFYYASEPFKQDENEMLIINGDSYTINVTWEKDTIDNRATAKLNGLEIFTINFNNGLSKQYRAERYVQSQKTIYSDIVGRYVNVYNNNTLYGYTETEYNDALAVVNLITNSSNFSNVSGWVGKDLQFRISPGFNKDTDISEYVATSFLKLTSGQDEYYFNMGIQNNKAYIPEGFSIGERYIFRIKARKYTVAPDGTDGEPVDGDYITNFGNFNFTIQGRTVDNNYTPIDPQYFELKDTVQNGDWLEYTMECIKSCSYNNLGNLKDPFGMFLTTQSTCWVEEVQFFKEVFGEELIEGGEVRKVRIDPGKMSIRSIAQPMWKYFDANQSGITKDSLEYRYIGKEPWAEAIPDNNNFERYGTIEADNSNRFNILQSIAETFECWIRFRIERDEEKNDGSIKYDENGPCKYVYLAREAGQKTGIGFIYGVDLKGVTRTLKSDKISTKTIVPANDNQFGKNGFCSIARSSQNYSKENVIYNFDYYIQHGLLDKDTLYNYLFDVYYPQLHDKNSEYDSILEDLVNKKQELTKQKASLTVYSQYVLASTEEKQSVEESLIKLSGTTSLEEAKAYVASHSNDIKVQTLIDDKVHIEKMIEIYSNLQSQLQDSVTNLEEYIQTLTARQNIIIEELNEINKEFYRRYSRFIQEGTWSSEDYWNDDLYYLDALQVAYTSSRPQIQYEINVLRLSDLSEYSSKVFNLGDISFIQDVKYFGYLSDGITPYKEQVILTEITSYFDTPEKDVIKVQNYKNQFDDLFQRITAATQNLEFSEGKYARAANIVNSDGTIKSAVIQNTFDTNKDLVYGAQNESATIDNTGITVVDNTDVTKQVKVTSGGIFVTNDGGETWKNAIRGDGISTELLTAGRINTEEIVIYNADAPSFRWDPYGLSAYKFNENREVDTTEFVRFDQYGMYGVKTNDTVFKPLNENEIYEKARFGLTWNRFFMKNSDGIHSIEISTDKDIQLKETNAKGHEITRIAIGRIFIDDVESTYGMQVRDSDNNLVFQCDDNGSYMSGWLLEPNCLSSTRDGQRIEIHSDGNIGCYGSEAITKTEKAYNIMTINAFSALNLTTTEYEEIPRNIPIYAFVSQIGSLITRYEYQGDVSPDYMSPPPNVPGLIPNPSSIIQINFNNINYEINNITWVANNLSKATRTQVVTDDKGNILYTVYTYYFSLSAKLDNTTLFTIFYNSPTAENIKHYIPASGNKWIINNQGDAIFHDIFADGGSIAGWWIDNESIYQTYDGTRAKEKDGKSNIKTQLNSNGTANIGNFDYSIITDAINASMATIGDMLMSKGMINGYNIAKVARDATQAAGLAQEAYNRVTTLENKYNSHKHSHNTSIRATSSTDGHTHNYSYLSATSNPPIY